jgi:hypothetical protein
MGGIGMPTGIEIPFSNIIEIILIL